jgi:16S rRNA C967 or C1407 C5-methylase (RsmB/RsmF family)
MTEPLEGQFDLVIVDAPCSGQSMAAKGKESGGGFHPATVNQNSNRQKRILACVAPCVKPGGCLAYMTCTYSPEENEEVVAWLLKKMPEFRPVPLGRMEPLQSHLTDIPCVRVWPHTGPGAGGFSCLLQREGGAEFQLNEDWLQRRSLQLGPVPSP